MPEKKICPVLAPDHHGKPQECLADKCGRKRLRRKGKRRIVEKKETE